MRRPWLIACLLAVAVPAAGDVTPLPPGPPKSDRAAACAHLTCRSTIRDLQLRGKDGAAIHVSSQTVPYVDDDGRVALYAGEAIEISFADRNDLRHPKFVRVIDRVDLAGLTGYHAGAPPPAGQAKLSLELRQTPGKADMMLVLRNDTGVAVKYDATMFVPTDHDMGSARTSTCAILPGTMGNEMWPHPVAMLLLSGFHKVDNDNISCE